MRAESFNDPELGKLVDAIPDIYAGRRARAALEDGNE